MKLYREVLSGIREIQKEMKAVEEKKATSVKRHQAFLAERKANSDTQKRIDAIRASIQHKSQSDQ